MENENKCFFSISLKNGITITGSNPDKVKAFLMDTFSAFVDCETVSDKQGYKDFAKQCDEYIDMITDALYTINRNYKTKEGRE